MKVALINDTHFGARNDSVKVAKHQKRFYDEVFFPYLKENNINTIIAAMAIAITMAIAIHFIFLFFE